MLEVRLNNSYWVHFKFEGEREERGMCFQERLNNKLSFFKGTQICASIASDWLIKALFALSGIPIALRQVIENEKREVFVWVILTKEPQ